MKLKNLGFSKISRMTLLKMLFVAGVTLAGAFALMGHPNYSCAAGDPKTPCDPEYMDALEARAWMEAQREIAQNQNFIFKPDSVLEYTCFDRFLNEAASNFEKHRQFSETDRWDGFPTDFSKTTTDDALTEVVLKPFKAYIASNFQKGDGGANLGAYLNNRTEEQYKAQDKVNGDEDYQCAEMQKVWKIARCMNFNEKSQNDFDGFFDFKYYEGEDPRDESPTWDLVCKDPDPRFKDARKAAFNEDQELFEIASELKSVPGNNTKYEEDDIVTHLDRILPGECNKSQPIPTGVKVQRPDVNGGSAYDEKICTNPGCTVEPGGSTCQ